ncbi:unnamed protein product [Notodromas monacha]|uniref:Glutamate--tRNA ligase n=1 Tax=Notodromas monacha TaxID=399045 RepID=A0A7R9BS65_9CRUS|nr:unnamed protein product [Notodromas monacha]CAG0919802.1 unnamed protein product [Notodromas monacha]
MARVLRPSLWRSVRLNQTCASGSRQPGIVRVRFAPSPTGFLHLGGLRTALHNYLFAKSRGGDFVLRIEDTDQTRLVAGAAEKLEEILDWVGIVPDESPLRGGNYGPYVQSERLNVYREHADRLLAEGKAYKCFCSEKALELLRKEQARRKEVPRYDNRCRGLSPEEIAEKEASGIPSCVRLKLEPGFKGFHDLVFGLVRHDVANAEGDPVILKADGFPTYHLANVVDDKAFGWKPPTFGHLPLIMNPDGTKLSKRQRDAFVEDLRDSGYYPEAVLSYVTESGGGGETGRANKPPELQSLGSLIQNFNQEATSPHSFSLQSDKLVVYNRQAFANRLKDPESRQRIFAELEKLVRAKHTTEISDFSGEYLSRVLDWGKDRITVLDDLVNNPEMNFLWGRPNTEEVSEVSACGDLVRPVRNLILEWESEDFVLDKIPKELKSGLKNSGKSFKACMKAARIALTGRLEGPSLAELLYVLGQRESAARLGVCSEVRNLGNKRERKTA